MKKIVFCYFAQKEIDYTPTDLGYLVAMLEKTFPGTYDFEILQLTYESRRSLADDEWEATRKQHIKRDVDLIAYHRPDAVFLFCENVLWSKVFALGRARSVVQKLRQRRPKIFIGIHSYKIQPDQAQGLLCQNVVDCVVTSNPEESFSEIGNILEKKEVAGACYLGKQPKEKESSQCDKEDPSSTLDRIPSPYLNHVFDNFIQMHQVKYRNTFRAFLVSSRGCRFGCYYCFRSVRFERVRYFSAKRFYDEMEYLLNTFGVHRFFVLDDAFLYSKQRLNEFSQEFRSRKDNNPKLKKAGLFIMARPETIDEDVVKLLSELQVECVQIGLQTINPELQQYMHRKIKTEYFQDISAWLRAANIQLWLDVVVGLPGDSIGMLKETMKYALSLGPASMQVKQFYLNPNTLFALQKEKYGIQTEQQERDFDTPYVTSANGIDERYFQQAHDFIMQQIQLNPQIVWKYIAKEGSFLSEVYFSRGRS